MQSSSETKGTEQRILNPIGNVTDMNALTANPPPPNTRELNPSQNSRMRENVQDYRGPYTSITGTPAPHGTNGTPRGTRVHPNTPLPFRGATAHPGTELYHRNTTVQPDTPVPGGDTVVYPSTELLIRGKTIQHGTPLSNGSTTVHPATAVAHRGRIATIGQPPAHQDTIEPNLYSALQSAISCTPMTEEPANNNTILQHLIPPMLPGGQSENYFQPTQTVLSPQPASSGQNQNPFPNTGHTPSYVLPLHAQNQIAETPLYGGPRVNLSQHISTVTASVLSSTEVDENQSTRSMRGTKSKNPHGRVMKRTVHGSARSRPPRQLNNNRSPLILDEVEKREVVDRGFSYRSTQKMTQQLDPSGGLVTKTSLSDIANFLRNLNSHFCAWREEWTHSTELRRHDTQMITDTISSLSEDVRDLAQTLQSNNPDSSSFKLENADKTTEKAIAAANSFIKLKSLLAFDPQYGDAELYGAVSDSKNPLVRMAAQIAFVDMFFKHCPIGSPLRPGSGASDDVKARLASTILTSEIHTRSAAYDDAWAHAALAAKNKAHYMATNLTRTLRAARPEFLDYARPVWVKSEDEAEHEYVEMAIAGFAFIINKVNYALQRMAAPIRTGGEISLSHAGPWARTALEIYAKLNNVSNPDEKRIGRVKFSVGLSNQALATLEIHYACDRAVYCQDRIWYRHNWDSQFYGSRTKAPWNFATYWSKGEEPSIVLGSKLTGHSPNSGLRTEPFVI
eukprot:IDg22687t1